MIEQYEDILKSWEYGTPVDCDCENNFIHIDCDCGCKPKEVCDCENILLEISKLKTQDTVLQREIDEISGSSQSGCCITPEEVDEKIASAKTEIEGEIPSLSGYATEEYVNAQISSQTGDFVTGEQLSSYTYDKATIDSKIAGGGIFDPTQYYTTAQTDNLIESAVTRVEAEIPTVPTSNTAFTNDAGYITSQSLSGYVTMEEFGDYIMALKSEIDTLRQQVSGCCDIPPTPTPTGDTDVAVRIKYTEGDDFVIPCEEYLIGNLESFVLPNIYTRPDATAVTVGDCIAQIGQGCFEDYFQLQTVYIGSACSSIRLLAFYNCSALTTVTIAAITPPGLVENNTFEGCTSLQHIFVPAESVDRYKSARYWSALSDIIEAIP